MKIESARQLAGYFDHTLLKPDVKRDDIAKTCAEAVDHGFYAVFVNPFWTSFASRLLNGTSVKVGTPIGFPLGASTTQVKVFEAEDAMRNGARELDMVINVGALKDGNHKMVSKDIAAVVNVSQGLTCKVIIETQFLSRDEKILACKIAQQAGTDFVKTSTGFFGGAATLEDVGLMVETVGFETGVKASGGIRTLQDTMKLIEAGATRIGSSASVGILNEWNGDSPR